MRRPKVQITSAARAEVLEAVKERIGQHPNASLDAFLIDVGLNKNAYYNCFVHRRPITRPTLSSALKCLGYEPSQIKPMIEEADLTVRIEATVNVSAAQATPAIPLHPSNLPHRFASLVGREDNKAVVGSLLAGHRLVTLVGTGGVGKTSLAITVGHDVLDQYPDGVWLVELAALAGPASPEAISNGICKSLGRPDMQGENSSEALTTFLSSRSLLLVLDNCEQVAAASAQLVQSLLKRCEQVRILATSREGLGLFDEKQYQVPTLEVPPANITAEALERSDGAALYLMGHSSVRLFMARAETQLTADRIATEQWLAIADICRQLDGIPLAIEMAAACTRAIALGEIQLRLSDRFRILRGESTSLPKNQTLKAVFDWSHDLLNDQEKSLFRRLAVFAGGWTIDAAEATVIGQDMLGSEVLSLLVSLVGKSLVERIDGPGYTRYRFLDTIRAYAIDRLADSADDDSRLQMNHRDYFVNFSRKANADLEGKDQARLLSELDRDLDNLEKALTYCKVNPDESLEGLRLAAILQMFWLKRGYLAKGRKWLSALLSLPQTQEPTRVRAAALNGIGTLALSQEDLTYAQTAFEESLTIYRLLNDDDDQEREAMCLRHLGETFFEQRLYACAQAVIEDALAIYKDLNDENGIAACIGDLGIMAFLQNDLSTSRDFLERAMVIQSELSNPSAVVNCRYYLGLIRQQEGDSEHAHPILVEVLNIEYAAGNKTAIARLLVSFAEMYAPVDPERAILLIGFTDKLREELGSCSALLLGENISLSKAIFILGDETVLALRRRGYAMTLEQAIALATGEVGDKLSRD